MTEPSDSSNDNKNITWHSHSVDRKDRWKNHGGAVLWFTGLSGSGKSSVANAVDVQLHRQGKRTYVLDGDNVRHGLCSDLGFSLEDRTENIRRIGEVAKLMADSGTIVMAAFVSPYRVDRDKVRSTLQAGNIPFVEIFVKASLETCEGRDPKGLYKMAREGKIKNFTGISDPFEEPLKPELVLDSNAKTVEQLALDVANWLVDNKVLEIS